MISRSHLRMRRRHRYPDNVPFYGIRVINRRTTNTINGSMLAIASSTASNIHINQRITYILINWSRLWLLEILTKMINWRINQKIMNNVWRPIILQTILDLHFNIMLHIIQVRGKTLLKARGFTTLRKNNAIGQSRQAMFSRIPVNPRFNINFNQFSLTLSIRILLSVRHSAWSNKEFNIFSKENEEEWNKK